MHDRADTTAFIELLISRREFFDPDDEIAVTRAPGRIDLMGGIADYSGSLVLELPIRNAAHVAVQQHQDDSIHITSVANESHDSDRVFEIELSEFRSGNDPIDYASARHRFEERPVDRWAAYIAGAFPVLMQELGVIFTNGVRILIHSEVPEGSGVSSSAAIEVATMQAIAAAFEIQVTSPQIAFLSQKVENLIAGAPCGVMDQMTAACGESGRLLSILCQPGELQGSVALPDELGVWGIDSGIRHAVSGAEYGTVRTAAFMGYRILAAEAGLSCSETGEPGQVEIDDPLWKGYLANITQEEFGVLGLRLPREMAGYEFLKRYGGTTDDATQVEPSVIYPVYEATRHPIEEHSRVVRFTNLLHAWHVNSEAGLLGDLMYEAHESYSRCGLGSDGTDDLVEMVRTAGKGQGLFGAKITGGGSGGVVAVLGRRDAEATVRAIAQEYATKTGRRARVISGSSPGAGVFGNMRVRLSSI